MRVKFTSDPVAVGSSEVVVDIGRKTDSDLAGMGND